MLVGIIILFLQHWAFADAHGQGPSFDFLDLLHTPMLLKTQIIIFIFFFFGFAFKTPLVPFHTWMPDVLHAGPVAMSVILAGIKLGTFGFVRFSLPLLPDASRAVLPVMM